LRLILAALARVPLPGDLQRVEVVGVDLIERRVARAPGVGERTDVEPAGRDRQADVVPVEDRDEPGTVIEMGVGQHDEIDAPPPRRQARPELREEPGRIGTSIDERDLAASLDEEGVALADVERTHPKWRCGGRGDADAGGHGHQDRDERERHRTPGRESRPARHGELRQPDAEAPRGEDGASGPDEQHGCGPGATRDVDRRERQRGRALDDDAQNERDAVCGEGERAREIERHHARGNSRDARRHECGEQRDGDEIGERGHE